MGMEQFVLALSHADYVLIKKELHVGKYYFTGPKVFNSPNGILGNKWTKFQVSKLEKRKHQKFFNTGEAEFRNTSDL